MSQQERLLTVFEMGEAYDAAEKELSVADDATRKCGWDITKRRCLLQAQDAKTYPLAFEAGKKAERDVTKNLRLAVVIAQERLEELEAKLNDREVDLIEAEKKGAKALARRTSKTCQVSLHREK